MMEKLLKKQIRNVILMIVVISVWPAMAVGKANNDALFFIESMDKKAGCIGVTGELDEIVMLMKSCTQQYEQIWSISKAKQIMTFENGLCLDSDDSKTNLPVLSKCDSSKQQKWKVKNKGNIKNSAGRCLGIRLGKTKDSVPQFEITKCTNNKLQRWLIINSKGYAAATKHKEAKGVVKIACPKDQFAHVAKKHVWGGYCVSCPSGFQRTQEKVDGPKACRVK